MLNFPMKISIFYRLGNQLEPRFDVVYPVKNGLEFGRLVDHVLRGGNFTHIVHPGGESHLFDLVFIEKNILKRTCVGLVNIFSDHHCQFDHPVDMTPGVRRLFVDGGGDAFDKGVE